MTTETKQRAEWAHGKGDELHFWRHYLATKGDRWPNGYAERMNPETPLQELIVRHLDPSLAEVSILDVGAGPLTIVGKRWEGHTVRLTAVDALADDYRQILAELRLEPPVMTDACETERLTERFQPNSFDLVHVRNALDHGYDVLLAIEQMLAVVKVGGRVVMDHFKNEAESQNYEGMHQWNLAIENGDMLIWNRNERHSLSRRFSRTARIVEISPEDGKKVIVVLEKIADNE